MQSYDRGYRADNVLTMLVDPLGSAYPPPLKQQQFYDQVEAEVRAVPGVADVGWSSGLPLGESVFGEYPFNYEVVGDAPLDAARKPTTGVSDRQRDVFLDARIADRCRPRLSMRATSWAARGC